jgi:hypothetical protein
LRPVQFAWWNADHRLRLQAFDKNQVQRSPAASDGRDDGRDLRSSAAFMFESSFDLPFQCTKRPAPAILFRFHHLQEQESRTQARAAGNDCPSSIHKSPCAPSKFAHSQATIPAPRRCRPT